MKFRGLAELGEGLWSTTKRSEMVDLVVDFLKRLEPEEVGPAVCMILGRPFPKVGEERLEVSWATLRDLVLRVTGAGHAELEAAFGRTGDLGEAAAILFATGKSGNGCLPKGPWGCSKFKMQCEKWRG